MQKRKSNRCEGYCKGYFNLLKETEKLTIKKMEEIKDIITGKKTNIFNIFKEGKKGFLPFFEILRNEEKNNESNLYSCSIIFDLLNEKELLDRIKKEDITIFFYIINQANERITDIKGSKKTIVLIDTITHISILVKKWIDADIFKELREKDEVVTLNLIYYIIKIVISLFKGKFEEISTKVEDNIIQNFLYNVTLETSQKIEKIITVLLAFWIGFTTLLITGSSFLYKYPLLLFIGIFISVSILIISIVKILEILSLKYHKNILISFLSMLYSKEDIDITELKKVIEKAIMYYEKKDIKDYLIYTGNFLYYFYTIIKNNFYLYLIITVIITTITYFTYIFIK